MMTSSSYELSVVKTASITFAEAQVSSVIANTLTGMILKQIFSYFNPHALTRPLRRKLRISADSSLIRQKICILFI